MLCFSQKSHRLIILVIDIQSHEPKIIQIIQRVIDELDDFEKGINNKERKELGMGPIETEEEGIATASVQGKKKLGGKMSDVAAGEMVDEETRKSVVESLRLMENTFQSTKVVTSIKTRRVFFVKPFDGTELLPPLK